MIGNPNPNHSDSPPTTTTNYYSTINSNSDKESSSCSNNNSNRNYLESIQASNDMYLVLFKQGLYSNSTITINNVQYKVHREILMATSGLFSGYFSGEFDVDTQWNIEVKDLFDEIASVEMIDLVFKIMYNSYCNFCNVVGKNDFSVSSDITRENLLERLNLHYILKFFCYNCIDEYDPHLDRLKDDFQKLFERLHITYSIIHNKTKMNWKETFPTRNIEESVYLLNRYLEIFRDKSAERMIKFDSKIIIYNGLRYSHGDNDFWIAYLYLNVMAPIFGQSMSSNPILRKVKRIPHLDLICFRNLLSMDESYLFLAPLIDFDSEILRNIVNKNEFNRYNEDEMKQAEIQMVTDCHINFPHSISHYLLSLFFSSSLVLKNMQKSPSKTSLP